MLQIRSLWLMVLLLVCFCAVVAAYKTFGSRAAPPEKQTPIAEKQTAEIKPATVDPYPIPYSKTLDKGMKEHSKLTIVGTVSADPRNIVINLAKDSKKDVIGLHANFHFKPSDYDKPYLVYNVKENASKWRASVSYVMPTSVTTNKTVNLVITALAASKLKVKLNSEAELTFTSPCSLTELQYLDVDKDIKLTSITYTPAA